MKQTIEFNDENVEELTNLIRDNSILKESEERYRQIINTFPEAIIITVDNKIVLANNEACKLIGADYDAIAEESIYKYIPLNYLKTVHRRIKRVLSCKEIRITNEYRLNCPNSKVTDVQVSLSFLMYKGKQAVLTVIKDISEIKMGLNKAAEIQRKTLQGSFPIPNKVNMETVYMPAKTVSGDFFRIHKVNDDLVIGIIVDVSGKGITAALNISAFDVLFHQEVLVSNKPLDIVNNLNKKLPDYLGENYVAVCCFSMDFEKNKASIVGAGINQFILKKKNCNVEERIVKGAFLGMFENSVFEEQILHFEKGDRFYFFTDGLDFIVDDDKIIQRYMQKVSIVDFKDYILNFLNDTIIETGSLKDDCTLLALEIT